MTDLSQDDQFHDWDFAHMVLAGAALCIFVSTDEYCTGCISESGDFETLFFLIQQQWGGCHYHQFAANFKAF